MNNNQLTDNGRERERERERERDRDRERDRERERERDYHLTQVMCGLLGGFQSQKDHIYAEKGPNG